MNITQKKQKEIRKKVIDKIPEIIKAKELRSEIAKQLEQAAISKLNSEEKWLFDNFPETLKSQFENGYYYEVIELGGNNINIKKLYNLSKYYYYYGNSYDNRHEIFSLSRLKLNDFSTNFPITYSRDLSNLDEVLDKTTSELLIKNINEFNNLLVIADSKVSKLDNILNSKEINMLDLKTHAPKLYDIIKAI